MMTFKKVKLGNICDVRDGTHDSPKESNSGFPLVTSKHIKNRRVDLSETYLISEADYEQINKRSQVHLWDILFSMIGTVGEIAFVKNNEEYAIKNVGLIKTGNENLGKYLFYYLWSPQAKSDLASLLSGSTQKFISLGKLREFPILLPPESTQTRIASVLSSYDDLIENNEKRIKALEKMAQLLYTEWFVRFKFPNHENVKMVESGTEYGEVPEGWEVKRLGDVANEIRESVDPTTLDAKTPYVGLEHIPRKSILLFAWGQASDINSSKLKFKLNDILFGKIRPYFHKVISVPIDGISSSDTVIIRAKNPIFQPLVLMCVSTEKFVAYATSNSQGTKMPRADWKSMSKYPFFIPNEKLLKLFSQKVNQMVIQINTLMFQNRNLSKTRDLLIPQLVTGRRELAFNK